MKPYRIRITTPQGVRYITGLFSHSFDAMIAALDAAGESARISVEAA